MKKLTYLYIVIDGQNNPLITKYLSKIESNYNIKAKTLSKHFQRTDSQYIKGTITVYKTTNIDLKSKNKGNVENFVSG